MSVAKSGRKKPTTTACYQSNISMIAEGNTQNTASAWLGLKLVNHSVLNLVFKNPVF